MKTRKRHWEESLSSYIANARENSFKWGQTDCAIFAAGAIKAVTGHDLAEGFKEQYSSWREAAMWLKANGYRSFQCAVTDRLGEPVHPAQAGRGDIVMRRQGNGNILGVCVGQFSWFLGDEILFYDKDNQPVTQPSLIAWPTLQCDVAWKVAPVEDTTD